MDYWWVSRGSIALVTGVASGFVAQFVYPLDTGYLSANLPPAVFLGLEALLAGLFAAGILVVGVGIASMRLKVSRVIVAIALVVCVLIQASVFTSMVQQLAGSSGADAAMYLGTALLRAALPLTAGAVMLFGGLVPQF